MPQKCCRWMWLIILGLYNWSKYNRTREWLYDSIFASVIEQVINVRLNIKENKNLKVNGTKESKLKKLWKNQGEPMEKNSIQDNKRDYLP